MASCGISSPLTAAGPYRIHTGFPRGGALRATVVDALAEKRAPTALHDSRNELGIMSSVRAREKTRCGNVDYEFMMFMAG